MDYIELLFNQSIQDYSIDAILKPLMFEIIPSFFYA